MSHPLVIGHRGAPGHLPEHTLASYRLAVRLGADALETDLVMTRDGVLVVRHEPELSRTTDVADRPEWRARRTSRLIGGRQMTGWFVDDFTLAELRTLSAPGPDDRVPTFDELLLLVRQESTRAGRPVGLHVEVKHPSYFASAGLPMAAAVLGTLRDHGLDRPESGVWVQSFDDLFLRRLDPITALPLVQLLEQGQQPDCGGIARYADAIGPARSLVLSGDRAATGLVARAHEAGLGVFVWTLRGDVEQARRFFDAGVDGVFTDYADRARAAASLLAATA